MRRDWIITVVLGLVIVIGLSISGYLNLKNKKNAEGNPSSTPTVAGAAETPAYFSGDAKVMYFYSDLCHWCQEEKTVLDVLGREGYRVKPMNVGEVPELWQQYNIEGTPTFVASNGDRLIGYQKEDILKGWLDKHKE